MCLALLLLGLIAVVPSFAAEFPYQHGLVCEGDGSLTDAITDLRDTTCVDPIGGVDVFVEDAQGHVVRTTTNERGEFLFPEPFVMDDRDYTIGVHAMGYNGAFGLLGVQHMPPARPASQVQVVFYLPRPELGSELDHQPILTCGQGVRYLLHSGVADNTCRMQGKGRYCWSATNSEAHAEASCDEGCTSTGGPGSCCRLGTAGCELRKVLRAMAEPKSP